MLAAFLVLALVIVAYTEKVGWAAVAVVSTYAMLFLILWCCQLRERPAQSKPGQEDLLHAE